MGRKISIQQREDHKLNQTKWPTGIGLAVLLLAAGYQLFCALQPIEFLLNHVLFLDDVFYYFNIAQNMSLQGRATFDGIHVTSGIQLLWGLILSIVAIFYNGRFEFLRAILILCIFLNVIIGILLGRLGRKLYSAEVGDLAILLWGGFMFALSPMMLGMEYSLHVVIIIATITSWWVVLNKRSSVTLWQLFALGFWLTLNYWTRLDSATYSLLIWLSVSIALYPVCNSRRSYVGRMAVLTVIPALGLIGYMATFYFLAGTFIPISGIVKAYYASQHFKEYNWFTSLAGHAIWWVRIQCRPMLDILSSIILASPLLRPLPLIVLFLVLIATYWCIRKIIREQIADPRQYNLMKFLGLLWIFGALHVVVIVTTIGHFSHVTQHYYGWLIVMWILWGAFLALKLLSRISLNYTRRLVITFMLVGFVIMHSSVAAERFMHKITPGLHERRFHIATWINENLPMDVQIGAWNAGVLGYFCDRTVVNLDGLVNDREFLRHLESNVSIREYLRQEKITYLVDKDAPDLTMPYRAAWDNSLLFRNSLPWTNLEKLYVETSGDPHVFVLRLRDDE
ncbi:MAG: hypothetical protein GY845_14135 [Planctomycetes bacterium]|nr:hypothetical protein [Planctomycetota bacterium]